MVPDEESVTLKEFFMYLKDNGERPRNLDSHFRPMTEFGCGYCQIKYLYFLFGLVEF